MKTIELAMLAAIVASPVVGCAAPAAEDEPTEQTAEALWNTGGGGDPDECAAAQAACYASCAKSRNASCYRYCDIVYAKCRGLPEPEIGLAVQLTSPSVEARR